MGLIPITTIIANLAAEEEEERIKYIGLDRWSVAFRKGTAIAKAIRAYNVGELDVVNNSLHYKTRK